MAFKLVVVACLVAVASGNVAGPVGQQLVGIDTPAYSYGYKVADTLTGDFKDQEETREGDLVRGHYSLVEPDGTRRVVDYYSGFDGFHALVRNLPVAEAVVNEPVARFAPRPVLAEPVVAKPAVARYAAVAEPVVEQVVAARYAAPARAVYAPAPARFAAPVAEFAAPGPFARYAAAGPLPAYRAAYPAPVAAAYATPAVASAYEYTINSGPAAFTAGPVAARFAPAPAVFTAAAPARYTAFAEPLARVAPAKIVAPAPAEGFRYP